MLTTTNPRIALAGSVSFSRVTLETLIRHGANVVAVLGLDPSAAGPVSDYASLDDVACAANIPYFGFTKINAPEVVETLRECRPDVFFVVGLSQLVGEELMSIPVVGSVGFHPTPLPIGRGRAPVAWLTHDGTPGAATFFVLVKEADAGAVFVHEPFDVTPGQYAEDVIVSVRAAIERALDRWLPSLMAGEWSPLPQDELRATFFGKRAPEDGLIDWTRPADAIAALVRAASRPYPGAYTYALDHKIVVWRARVDDARFRGVVGRVLDVAADGSALVQTGQGLLRIEELEILPRTDRPRPKLGVGLKLGIALEDEIFRLGQRIAELERLIERLTTPSRK
jgi:methionyl-tRNA formyltransferase